MPWTVIYVVLTRFGVVSIMKGSTIQWFIATVLLHDKQTLFFVLFLFPTTSTTHLHPLVNGQFCHSYSYRTLQRKKKSLQLLRKGLLRQDVQAAAWWWGSSPGGWSHGQVPRPAGRRRLRSCSAPQSGWRGRGDTPRRRPPPGPQRSSPWPGRRPSPWGAAGCHLQSMVTEPLVPAVNWILKPPASQSRFSVWKVLVKHESEDGRNQPAPGMMASLVSTRPILAELAGENQEKRITQRETQGGVHDQTHDNANAGVSLRDNHKFIHDCSNMQCIRVWSPDWPTCCTVLSTEGLQEFSFSYFGWNNKIII